MKVYKAGRVWGCLLLTVFVMTLFAPTVSAAPHINWKTTEFYYDESGIPVIKGYFYNDGTETVDKINWLRQEVWIRGNGSSFYLYLGSATWGDFPILLRPGEQSELYRLRWTYYKGPVYNFDAWRTSGLVNFHVVTPSTL